MAALTLDTYRIVTALKSRGFNEEQAQGVVEAIRSVELDAVATKSDVEIAVERAKNDILKWMIPLVLGLYGLIAFKLI